MAKNPKTKTGKPTKKPATPNKGGRPSLYTDELLKEICQRLSTGEPLTVICGDDHMPCDGTVRDWMEKSEKVSAAIAHARARGYDAIAKRARETARGNGDSTKDVQRDKLIVDTDLKLLAKWDPKRYGDRQQVDHGLQKGNPIENLLGAIAGKTFVPVANPPQDDDEA